MYQPKHDSMVQAYLRDHQALKKSLENEQVNNSRNYIIQLILDLVMILYRTELCDIFLPCVQIMILNPSFGINWR